MIFRAYILGSKDINTNTFRNNKNNHQSRAKFCNVKNARSNNKRVQNTEQDVKSLNSCEQNTLCLTREKFR